MYANVHDPQAQLELHAFMSVICGQPTGPGIGVAIRRGKPKQDKQRTPNM